MMNLAFTKLMNILYILYIFMNIYKTLELINITGSQNLPDNRMQRGREREIERERERERERDRAICR